MCVLYRKMLQFQKEHDMLLSKDVCENCLEDRAYWERMYPGYTLHRCEVIITGNSTRHLIVSLYRKELPKNKNRRNQP